jgi:hypothetical protein
MRRRRAAIGKRDHRNIADIGVTLELNPAEAFMVFIKNRRLAIKRLRIDRHVLRGLRAQVGEPHANFDALAFDVMIRRDFSAQMGGGEVGPRGRQAAVKTHLQTIFYGDLSSKTASSSSASSSVSSICAMMW